MSKKYSYLLWYCIFVSQIAQASLAEKACNELSSSYVSRELNAMEPVLALCKNEEKRHDTTLRVIKKGCSGIFEVLWILKLIDRTEKNESEVLREAARFGTPKMMSLLLQDGADHMSGLYLQEALLYGNYAVADLLLGCNHTQVQRELLRLVNGTSCLVRLIRTFVQSDELGEQINRVTDDGRTILTCALDKFSKNRDASLFRKIWRIKGLNKEGLLHEAAEKYSSYVVSSLISKGKSGVNELYRGHTPLHCSVRKGRIRTTRVLLECGANVNAIDSISGMTPLHIALLKNLRRTAQLLKKYGARIDVKDKMGRIPFDCYFWTEANERHVHSLPSNSESISTSDVDTDYSTSSSVSV